MYKVKLMIERCAFINQVVFVLNVSYNNEIQWYISFKLNGR